MRQYLASLEQIGVKLGLEQIRALVEHLDRPDRAFPSIIVAGTNGKGSVTAMVERGLRAAGYRTGRYTSPHLLHLEERFVVDGVAVRAGDVDAAAETVRAVAERLPAPPSFFEATTAMAFVLFRDAAVEVAVLEVGLGGRLDATNVVTPVGAAITAIDFDHEMYLGDTIDAIAREKAGVIKTGSVVVLAENPAEVQAIVEARATEVGAAYLFAPAGTRTEAALVDGRTRLSLETPHARYGEVTLALRGRHQVDNAVAAVRLLEALGSGTPFQVSDEAIRTALTDVVWPGRLELRRWRDHEVLIDGAHNPAGARALASYLRETYGRRLPMVIGAMRDKKIEAVIAALAVQASHFVFTAAASSRAASPADLSAIAEAVAPLVPASVADRPLDAVARACALGSPAVVAGSLYLAGEVRAELS